MTIKDKYELAQSTLGLTVFIVITWMLINLFNVPVWFVAAWIIGEMRVSYWRVKHKRLVSDLKSNIRYAEGSRLSIAPRPNERYAVVYYDSIPITAIELNEN